MMALQFVDAANIRNEEKMLKNTACWKRSMQEVTHVMDIASKQLEEARTLNLDVSSCNIGIVHLKSSNLLDTMHLVRDNIRENNKCVKNILHMN